MEPSKYEPLLQNDGMSRLLLCQGAYKYLLSNGGIPGDAEAEEAKRQAERDRNWEAFAAAIAVSQQAQLDAWAASEAGRTHLECAKRWHRKKVPPTFQEAKTIVHALLAALPNLSKKHPQGPLRADSWFESGIFQDRDMQMLRYFIQDSKFDPVYWDALEIICERLGESGDDMPPELMKWRLENPSAQAKTTEGAAWCSQPAWQRPRHLGDDRCTQTAGNVRDAQRRGQEKRERLRCSGRNHRLGLQHREEDLAKVHAAEASRGTAVAYASNPNSAASLIDRHSSHLRVPDVTPWNTSVVC